MQQPTTLRAKSADRSETALSIVSDWTPWVAALAPAMAIGVALQRHGQPWLLIVPVAVAVELGGVLAGHTLTEAREYNELAPASRRDTRPLWAALLIYAAIGCVLSVLLDAMPTLEAWWPVALPLLAVVVYWVNGERIVIRRLHSALADATEAQVPQAPDLQVQLAEVAARLQMLPALSSAIGALSDRVLSLEEAQFAPLAPASGEVAGASEVQLTDEQRRLLAYLERNPDANYTDIGKHLGKSRPTATSWVQELMDAGIVTRNGHGWKIHA